MSRIKTCTFAAASAACAIFALIAGKDQHWDLLNYHYYAGYALADDRFAKDFFGASIQSYLNPAPYLPFYLMVRGGLPDWLIGLALAVFVSLALWAIIDLAALVTDNGKGPDWPMVIMAGALAFLAPVFLAQVGSTFADATTAVFVLWGYVFLLRAHLSTVARELPAGLLFGAAVALKPTNLPFVLASILLVQTDGAYRATVKRAGVLAAASLVAVLILAMPWARRVFETFGNPVFPLMNGWFASDAFPAINFSHTRYLPATLEAALMYPLEIAAPKRYVYTETVAPDLRFLVVFLLIIIAVLVSAKRALREGAATDRALIAQTVVNEPKTAPAPLKKLTWVFCISWVMWLVSSGNGRYFMPMVLLAAALVIGWIWHLVPVKSWRYLLAGLLLALQAWLTFDVSNLRWTPITWSGRWFDIDVPEKISNRPVLVLSADTQSNSFLAPFLDRDSSFVNVSGQFALGPGYPGWSRLETLLSKHVGSTFFLFESPLVDGAGRAIRPHQARLDAASARFGLSIDATRCSDMLLRDVPSLQLATEAGGLDGAVTGRMFRGKYIILCPAVDAPDLKRRYLEDLERVKRVFHVLEERCPRDFFPPAAAIEGSGSLWWRNYVNSDGRVTISNDVVRVGVVGKDEQVIGKVSRVLDGTVDFHCFSGQGS